MEKEIDKKEYNKTFAALKLIEALFIDGKIKYHVFRNILDGYKDVVDLSEFNCYTWYIY